MHDIHLLQLTDTHLFADPERELGGVITDRSLRQVVHHMLPLARDADAVLATGDLVHDGSARGYENLRVQLMPLSKEIYYLPGNHDDPHQMAKVFGDEACGACVLEKGDWRILLLSTWQAATDAGHLAEAQLVFLEEALAANSGSPTLIAMHHPPIDIDCPWLDAMGVANAAELWRILRPHRQVRAITCGHIHQELDQMVRRVRVLGTPSTCFQFLPGSQEYAQDVMPPGFRHLRLKAGGMIDTQVERI